MPDRQVRLTDRQASILRALAERQMELMGVEFLPEWYGETGRLLLSATPEELEELRQALTGGSPDQ